MRSSTPTRAQRPASPPSAGASPPCARSCARWTERTPAGSRPWPTTWSKNPCGSSGATAGPTTSATGAWITCWRAEPTSRCSCSTPRCIRTRRAVLKVHSHRGGREVCGRWQGLGKEGPCAHGHAVSPRLCRPDRLRGKGQPDRHGLPRGGRLRGTRADHRLLPLHRARLPTGTGSGAAEARGRKRLLATVPVGSATGRFRRPAQARLRAAQGRPRPVHGQRDALQHAQARRTRAGGRTGRARAGAGAPALCLLPAPGRAQRSPVTGRWGPSRGRACGLNPEHNPPMNLSTQYLGLKLENPLVIGASPFCDSVDSACRLQEAGAAAVVMRSLFEEQIESEIRALAHHIESPAESNAEATSYFPNFSEYQLAPDQYLRQIEALKRAISIPVIGSLNGARLGADD